VTASVRALVDRVATVKMIIDEVSEASHQQAQGIEQVTEAISEIEKVTHTTAATAEESATASEQLTAHADATLTSVVRLQAMVAGAQAPPSASGAKASPGKAGAPQSAAISADRAA